MLAENVSMARRCLLSGWGKARILLTNSLIAFVDQNPNLLDQVGVGLENPHWRGERVTLLPLSAFSASPSPTQFLINCAHLVAVSCAFLIGGACALE